MKNFFYITTPIVLFIALLVWAIPPYEVRKERRNSRYLTNEEIVEKTKYCKENGLRADVVYFGGIKEITCFPVIDTPESKKEGNIKKSNITEVNISIPNESTPQ